jgi:GNAT superfamily N-acetyltransferase
MALFYPRYSTWRGPTIHLEDLIVKEKWKSNGIGRALYKEFIQYAFSQKVRRVEWVVLDWNKNAIDFYNISGAKVLQDWRTVQMDYETMDKYLKNIN